MKLTLALGYGSVEELLSNISNAELQEWIAYYSVEPFPEERADLRTAQLITVLTNIWRDKEDKVYSIEDFLFDFWRTPSQKESSEAMLNKVEMFNMLIGGLDMRNK